jgi:membrane protein
VHEAGQTKSYIRQRLFSFLIVIGMGLMGIMALVVNLILTWFGAFLERLFSISEYNSSILSGLVTLALLTLTCAIFYKILPETPIAWKDVWLGSVTASVLVMIAISLAALFFRYTSPSSALQAAGGFTILMLGFYYIAQIFLLGAIICRVYASMFGSKRLLTTHP